MEISVIIEAEDMVTNTEDIDNMVVTVVEVVGVMTMGIALTEGTTTFLCFLSFTFALYFPPLFLVLFGSFNLTLG